MTSSLTASHDLALPLRVEVLASVAVKCRCDMDQEPVFAPESFANRDAHIRVRSLCGPRSRAAVTCRNWTAWGDETSMCTPVQTGQSASCNTLGGDRPQDEAPERPIAVSRHHDQSRTYFQGNGDDGARRVAFTQNSLRAGLRQLLKHEGAQVLLRVFGPETVLLFKQRSRPLPLH